MIPSLYDFDVALMDCRSILGKLPVGAEATAVRLTGHTADVTCQQSARDEAHDGRGDFVLGLGDFNEGCFRHI